LPDNAAISGTGHMTKGLAASNLEIGSADPEHFAVGLLGIEP
jgi:hypothetical protein